MVLRELDIYGYPDDGSVILNCMCTRKFNNPSSLSDIVPFQRLIRTIIISSQLGSSLRVDLVVMGKPAESAWVGYSNANLGRYVEESRAVSSMDKYVNPAIHSRLPEGDRMSPSFTSGCPGPLRVLASIISNNLAGGICTISSFSLGHSSVIENADRVMEEAKAAAEDLVGEIEDAFKNLHVIS